MDSGDNEDCPAGPRLVLLIVGLVHGPIVLHLKPLSAQVCPLHLPRGPEPRLSAWTSGGLFRIEHRRAWIDMDSQPPSVLPALGPEIFPWETPVRRLERFTSSRRRCGGR